MTVIYAPLAKTKRMEGVIQAIDAGGSAGRIEICTAAYGTILATVTLGYPGASTGTVSGPTLTLAGFPRSDASADNSGQAAVARIRSSDGADVITGLTVGTESGDLIVNNLNFEATRSFTVNFCTFTHS